MSVIISRNALRTATGKLKKSKARRKLANKKNKEGGKTFGRAPTTARGGFCPGRVREGVVT